MGIEGTWLVKTKERKRVWWTTVQGSEIFIRAMQKTGAFGNRKGNQGPLKKKSCQGVQFDSEIWFQLLLQCDSKCFSSLMTQTHCYPEAIPKSLAVTYLPFWVSLSSHVDLLLLFHIDVWGHWELPQLCVFPKRKKNDDLNRFFKTP